MRPLSTYETILFRTCVPVPPSVRRQSRRFDTGLAFVFALVVAMALLARAAPAATVGPTELFARGSIFFADGGVFDPKDEETVPDGARDRSFRAFKQVGTFGAQFPAPVNPSFNVFASADARGDGSYGSGASGILFQPMKLRAESQVQFSYLNEGIAPEKLPVTFSIPRMEASIAGTSVMTGITARATAESTYAVVDPSGAVRKSGTFFELWLEMRKFTPTPGDPFGSLVDWSKDLDRAMDIVGEPTATDSIVGPLSVASVVMPEFSAKVTSPKVLPGETLLLSIFGDAEIHVEAGGVEGGAQALVGDPFEAILGGGPVVVFPGPDAPAPVPLPAGAWLVLSGIAALVLARRRGVDGR